MMDRTTKLLLAAVPSSPMNCASIVAIAFIFVAMGSFLTRAEDLPSEAVFRPVTRGGAITGCSIQYKAIARDDTYKQGRPVGLTGSLNWLKHPKEGISLFLRVVGVDIDLDNPNNETVFFQIPNAFVVINEKAFHADQKIQCDNEAGFCGLFSFAKAIDASKIFGAGGESTAFNFNRTPDGLDVSVPLPALTADQNLQLNDCMVTLMTDVLKH
jgi:hypothetical protein